MMRHIAPLHGSNHMAVEAHMAAVGVGAVLARLTRGSAARTLIHINTFPLSALVAIVALQCAGLNIRIALKNVKAECI